MEPEKVTMVELLESEVRQWRRTVAEAVTYCHLGMVLNVIALLIDVFRIFARGEWLGGSIAASSHLVGIFAIVWGLRKLERWLHAARPS